MSMVQYYFTLTRNVQIPDSIAQQNTGTKSTVSKDTLFREHRGVWNEDEDTNLRKLTS
jgi:hypothetical protein